MGSIPSSAVYRQWEKSDDTLPSFSNIYLFCCTLFDPTHAPFILCTLQPVLLHVCLTPPEINCFPFGKNLLLISNFGVLPITCTRFSLILLPLIIVSFLWNVITYVNIFKLWLIIATSFGCLLFAMNFSRQLTWLITISILQNSHHCAYYTLLPNII